eukprot:SM000018S03639  [mRNA]  locus=s18:454497:455146:- [translate_table: standard]
MMRAAGVRIGRAPRQRPPSAASAEEVAAAITPPGARCPPPGGTRREASPLLLPARRGTSRFETAPPRGPFGTEVSLKLSALPLLERHLSVK